MRINYLTIVLFLTLLIGSLNAAEKGGGIDPNQGVIYMIMAGSTTVPSPFPISAAGVYMSLSWAQVEPQRNKFDWSQITMVENQLPAGKFVQVAILVGANGSPTSSASCTFRGKAIPNCQPWLGSVPGVKVHSTPGPNGASNGYPTCTVLREPNPASPLYVSAWEGLVDAFEKKFKGDTKIGLVSLMPMSDSGFNLSLSATNSSDVTACSPEFYNSQWNQLSGCKGNETCWTNYVENAFRTLWGYEITHMSDQNLMLWNPSFPYPSISGGDGSYNFDIRDYNLKYAAANHPTQGTYQLGNEALQASHSWSNAVKRWSVGTNKLGAQMARSNADNCDVLRTAGIDYGKASGANWIEIYRPDFDTCPGEIAAIANALANKNW